MKLFMFITLLFSVTTAAALDKFDIQFALSGSEEEIMKAMDLKRRDVLQREIFLFDSETLALFAMKIQIRLRIEGDEAELGVKRWGIEQDEFARLRESFGSQCETDVHGEDLIRSCAVKKIMPVKKALNLLNRGVSLFELFNREQIALMFEGGSPPLKLLSSTLSLGPITSRVWEWHDEAGSKYSIDVQTLPDGTQFAELSVKTKTEDHLKKIAKLRGDLLGRGLLLSEDQHGRRPQKLNGLINCARLLKTDP